MADRRIIVNDSGTRQKRSKTRRQQSQIVTGKQTFVLAETRKIKSGEMNAKTGRLTSGIKIQHNFVGCGRDLVEQLCLAATAFFFERIDTIDADQTGHEEDKFTDID